MLRTVLLGLGVWGLVSVPVALLVGRIMSIGAGDQLQPARATVHRHPARDQRAA